MAAAAATGSEGATQATIPVGSGLMIPVREGAEEVVFDVEGVEIATQAELEAVEGGRPVRDDPNKGLFFNIDLGPLSIKIGGGYHRPDD